VRQQGCWRRVCSSGCDWTPATKVCGLLAHPKGVCKRHPAGDDSVQDDRAWCVRPYAVWRPVRLRCQALVVVAGAGGRRRGGGDEGGMWLLLMFAPHGSYLPAGRPASYSGARACIDHVPAMLRCTVQSGG
jgi:hypothetical protein